MANFIAAFGHALWMAFAMFWEILWPLILGFGLSGAVQAVVSKGEMSKLLPNDSPKSLAVACGLGAASSSCSYAAVALARSIFRKGADFTAAMAFELASTNLVAELSIILIVLMGWQFAHCWRAGRVGAAALLERFLSQFAPRCINHLGTDSRPLVAVLSFVCSVGNIPLAAVLWNGGISFGGVIAFIYADLIVFAIINIYRKYYGWKVTALIVAVFYIAMALAALLVEFLFQLFRLIPYQRSAQIVETST